MLKSIVFPSLFMLFLLAFALSGQAAWQPEPVSYTISSQFNVPITMSDGTIIMCDVYNPIPIGAATPGPFPVIITGTPYGKSFAQLYFQTNNSYLAPLAEGFSGYDPYLIQRGYIEVIYDVRGTGDSGGSFDLVGPDQVADSVQIINWAAHLTHSSGAVGMIGLSYGAMNQLQAAAAVGPNSPLKAIFPVAADNDIYSDFALPGGLINLESDIFVSTLYGLLPVVNPFLEDPATDQQLFSTLAQHQSLITFSGALILNILTNGDQRYDGTYWQSRSSAIILDKIIQNKIPVYLVGGFYDIFQAGEPLNYVGLQNAWYGQTTTAPMKPNQPVTGRYQLLLKPQFHSTLSDGPPNLDPIALAWFDHWLKNINSGIEQTQTPVHAIETDGSWVNTSAYPVPQAVDTTYYLNTGSTLTTSKPTSLLASDLVVFTGVSLPCNQATEQWILGFEQAALMEFGLTDPCASQNLVPPIGPGQATYTTAPFTNDVAIAGPSTLQLQASATTTDTEWVVQLSMIAPNGTSIPITQGDLLGSFRKLDQTRTWYAPNSVPILAVHPFTRDSVQLDTPLVITTYNIAIRPTFMKIPAGYRLQLTISTSQLPNLLPTPTNLLTLIGGIYSIQRNVISPSLLEVPIASWSSFNHSAPVGAGF